MLLIYRVKLDAVSEIRLDVALVLVSLYGRSRLVRHLSLVDFVLGLKDLFFQISDPREEGILFARFQVVGDAFDFLEIFIAPITDLFIVFLILVVIDLSLVSGRFLRNEVQFVLHVFKIFKVGILVVL